MKRSKIEVFLQNNPTIKQIIFTILGIKSIPKILIGIGGSLLFEPLMLKTILQCIYPNVLNESQEKYKIFIGIFLIFLGVFLHYVEKSDKRRVKIEVEPKIISSMHIKRIVERKLLHKNVLFPALSFAFILEIMIFFYYMYDTFFLDNYSVSNKIIWIQYIGNLIPVILLLYLIRITGAFTCSSFLLARKKIKFLILYEKSPVCIELGSDNYVYLTEYQFPNCLECGKSFFLKKEGGFFWLVCKEYNNHRAKVDISKFDKFSNL